MSRAGALVVNAELTDIEVHDCDAVERAGCASTGTGPYNCPLEGAAVCVGGQCQDSLHISSPSPDGGTGAETRTEAGTDGPRCCPLDPLHSGCMDLGGLAQSGCHQVCEFWCSTNWRVELDDQGCEVWRMDYRLPAAGESAFCLPDGGAGTDADAQSGN